MNTIETLENLWLQAHRNSNYLLSDCDRPALTEAIAAVRDAELRLDEMNHEANRATMMRIERDALAERVTALEGALREKVAQADAAWEAIVERYADCEGDPEEEAMGDHDGPEYEVACAWHGALALLQPAPAAPEQPCEAKCDRCGGSGCIGGPGMLACLDCHGTGRTTC